MAEVFAPGTYTVISDGNSNIRWEPRLINGVSTNIVGQHTPGTQVEVYEVLIDKKMMVWGRISAVHPGTGKANWMCIHTGNRMLLQPAQKLGNHTLTVMIDGQVIFETQVK